MINDKCPNSDPRSCRRWWPRSSPRSKWRAIYTYIYIYILCFIYLYIYKSICMYMYIALYIYIYREREMSIYIYIYIYIHIERERERFPSDRDKWGQHEWGRCEFHVSWQRDFLGTLVNLLVIFPNLSKIIAFAAVQLVLTRFVRNQQTSSRSTPDPSVSRNSNSDAACSGSE